MFGFTFLALSLLFASATAHTYPNNGRTKNLHTWKPGSNPCDGSNTDVPNGNVYARGQSVSIQYARNNHRGGFIRMIALPMAANPSMDDFNQKGSVLSYECYTGNCASTYEGFDPGFTKFCGGAQWKMPSSMDGDYVVLWQQYLSYDSSGVYTEYLPLYSNCINMRISGGDALTNDTIVPQFKGGDYEISVLNKNEVQSGQDASALCRYKGDGDAAFPTGGIDVNDKAKTSNFKLGAPPEYLAAVKNGAATAQNGAANAEASSQQARPTATITPVIQYTTVYVATVTVPA